MNERQFWIEIRRGIIGVIDGYQKGDGSVIIRNGKKIVAAIERRFSIDPKFDADGELDKK